MGSPTPRTLEIPDLPLLVTPVKDPRPNINLCRRLPAIEGYLSAPIFDGKGMRIFAQ
jgi:hypothetical protein